MGEIEVERVKKDWMECENCGSTKKVYKITIGDPSKQSSVKLCSQCSEHLAHLLYSALLYK